MRFMNLVAGNLLLSFDNLGMHLCYGSSELAARILVFSENPMICSRYLSRHGQYAIAPDFLQTQQYIEAKRQLD